MPNTLFLRLQGPLQSWGSSAAWVNRDTLPWPSKSGLIGQLAAALGTQDADQIKGLAQALRLGVRVDRAGDLMIDFHTVGATLAATGKLKWSSSRGEPERMVTRRSYLADASFLAAFQGEPALIDDLAEALQHPVWAVYLGRRSCIPTRPVFDGTGEYADLRAALQSRPLDGGRWAHWNERPGTQRILMVLDTGTDADTGLLRVRDVPSQPAVRTFASRLVTQIYLDIPVAYPQTEIA